MPKKIVALFALFLVASAPVADAKAFYVDCGLMGTRSGENVMTRKTMMGHRAIDSVNLIRTSASSYHAGETIKVKISNLDGYGSVINFSGGQVSDPPGYKKWNCPNGISNFYTHDHGKGVARNHVLVLKIPSPPPPSITISALTADPYGAVTRQSHTIFLSERNILRDEDNVMQRECGGIAQQEFLDTLHPLERARMDMLMGYMPKCTAMRWRVLCNLCSDRIDDAAFSACMKGTSGPRANPPVLRDVCIRESWNGLAGKRRRFLR